MTQRSNEAGPRTSAILPLEACLPAPVGRWNWMQLYRDLPCLRRLIGANIGRIWLVGTIASTLAQPVRHEVHLCYLWLIGIYMVLSQ